MALPKFGRQAKGATPVEALIADEAANTDPEAPETELESEPQAAPVHTQTVDEAW